METKLAATRMGTLVLALLLCNGGCKQSHPPTSGSNAGNLSATAAPGACTPLSSGAPKPAEYPPMTTAQGACSEKELDGLFDACFRSGGNCAAWETTNRSCARCAFTPENDNAKGPFLTRKNAVPKVNQRGCLNSLASGCGTAYESVTECTHAACNTSPECKSATSAEQTACRQAAMQTSCAPLMQQFSEKCGVGGLTDKRACFPKSEDEATMRDFITGLARRACGS